MTGEPTYYGTPAIQALYERVQAMRRTQEQLDDMLNP